MLTEEAAKNLLFVRLNGNIQDNLNETEYELEQFFISKKVCFSFHFL